MKKFCEELDIPTNGLVNSIKGEVNLTNEVTLSKKEEVKLKKVNKHLKKAPMNSQKELV